MYSPNIGNFKSPSSTGCHIYFNLRMMIIIMIVIMIMGVVDSVLDTQFMTLLTVFNT
jgi:hypothetical protein